MTKQQHEAMVQELKKLGFDMTPPAAEDLWEQCEESSMTKSEIVCEDLLPLE
jgi:hypothetical protein